MKIGTDKQLQDALNIDAQKKRRVFKSDVHESRFWNEGFFTLQLLDENDLEYAQALFEELDPKVDKVFYSSIDSRDIPYRKMVDQRLRERFEQKVMALFESYEPIAFTFIVKRPGEGSEVVQHVDDIHVDPDKFASVNVWIPLIDTNEENGCMEVLPGSHHLPFPRRGLGLPFPYSQYYDLYKDYIIKVPQKAGQAIIYHDELLHSSGRNNSDAVRPAMITGLVPSEAQPIIYFNYPGMSEEECEAFEIDHEFWFSFDKTQKPEGYKSLGREPYWKPGFPEAQFWSYFPEDLVPPPINDKLNSLSGDESKASEQADRSILSKLKSLFS